MAQDVRRPEAGRNIDYAGAAVFAAAKGKLTGPVKTQFGYYVFQVQKISDDVTLDPLILLAGVGALADRQYVEAFQAALPASAQTALAVAPAKI